MWFRETRGHEWQIWFMLGGRYGLRFFRLFSVQKKKLGLYWFAPSERSTYCKFKPVSEFQLDEFRGWSRNVSHGETHTKGRTTTEALNPQRLLPYRQSRFTVNPKYESSDFSLRHHKPEPVLFDVNLEVKSSYRPQHVPYISLVSKLNGRPITGHPVTVEVLDDGFCSQLLLSTSECYSSSYDNTTAEDTSALQAVDMVNGTKPSSCGKVPTKNLRLHPPRRTSPSKSSKSKKNTALSKKMRKLSSLTGSHKQSQEKKRSVQKLIGPVVACVPLKVVFSRINEALNSSVRAGHRITGTSNGWKLKSSFPDIWL